MTILHRLRAWVRAAGRPGVTESEMQEEMAAHLERSAERFRKRGMRAADAIAAARREFGNVPVIQEAARDSRATRWLLDLRQDLALAWRQTLRAPLTTATTVGLLAIGAAGAGLAFAITRAYLLDPLPVPEAHRLAYVIPAATRDAFETVPNLRPVDWRAASELFEATASWDLDGFTIVSEPTPDYVNGAWVSEGYFELTGGRTQRGRLFTSDEYVAGNRVAIISDALWRGRYGAADSIVGTAIRMHSTDRPNEQEIVTIIGVLAPQEWRVNGFQDVLRPLGEARIFSLARPPRGMSFDAAAARLTAAVRPQVARADSAWRFTLVTALDEHVYRIRPMLQAFDGIAALLLLLAVTSAGALILARGDERAQEVAVRRALGASSSRIGRQLLAELGLTWAIATALGIALTAALAAGAGRQVELLGRVSVPSGLASIGVDLPLVAFVAVVSLAPLVMLGFVPLLRALAGGERGVAPGTRVMTSPGSSLMRRGLVVAQVTIAVALVLNASLLVQSVRGMSEVALGFESENLLKAHLLLPTSRYADAAARSRVAGDALERIGRVAGVEGATIVHPHPFRNTAFFPYECEGCEAGRDPIRATHHTIAANYFDVMAVPVIAGRRFVASDDSAAPRVAIVSTSFAAALGGASQALGKRVRVRGTPAETPWLTVVGVAGDVRKTFGDTLYADLYVPFAQNPRAYFALMTRTREHPLASVTAVRRAVAAGDPALALSDVESMSDVLAARRGPQRILASFAGATASLALTLAACALYAVVAWLTRRRRREFALRLALGAGAESIAGLVMREGTRLLAIGAVAGVALAAAGAHLLRNQLFGVGALDASSYAGTVIAVALIAALAFALPAVRASRQSPAQVLREEG